MEPVPVVRKTSSTWIWWVIAAVVVIVLMLWLFGAFGTGTGTGTTTGQPGAELRPAVDSLAQAAARLFA